MDPVSGTPSGAVAPASTRAGASGGDTAAVIAAKQARSDAQARVDADRRAHSPGCVAVDEKGLAKAEAQLGAALAQVQAQAPQATGPTRQLSIEA